MAMKAPNKLLHLFGEGAVSLLVFLILILFILVSHLSTHLLNNTEFWFFISNTLIFIIAADCGAFSPPATHFHGGGHRRSNNSATQFPNQQNPQHNFKIVVTEPANSANQLSHTTEVDYIPIKLNPKKSYQRSKSEKVIRMADKDKKSAMRIRSKTMIRYEEASKMIEKDNKINEFAQMTNEELNRRIDDFIQRFNTKIKFEQMLGHCNEKY